MKSKKVVKEWINMIKFTLAKWILTPQCLKCISPSIIKYKSQN